MRRPGQSLRAMALPHGLPGAFVAAALLTSCGGRTDLGSRAAGTDNAPLEADASCSMGCTPRSSFVSTVGYQVAMGDVAVADLAAAPGGPFLSVWLQSGAASSLRSVWSSVASFRGGGSLSTPRQLADAGSCPRVAWTGSAFALVSGDSQGLVLQHLDQDGVPADAPARIWSTANGNACPTSLVATDSGLALAWTEGQSDERAALVGPDSVVRGQALLSTTGNGTGAHLAVIAQRLYSAFAQSGSVVVAELDQSGVTGNVATVAHGSLTLPLLVRNCMLAIVVDDGLQRTLYEGTTYGGFRSVMQVAPSALQAASDGCGDVLVLQGTTEGALNGPLAAKVLSPENGESDYLRSAGHAVDGTVIGAGPAQFGILWSDRPAGGPTTLFLGTLGWQ